MSIETPEHLQQAVEQLHRVFRIARSSRERLMPGFAVAFVNETEGAVREIQGILADVGNYIGIDIPIATPSWPIVPVCVAAHDESNEELWRRMMGRIPVTEYPVGDISPGKDDTMETGTQTATTLQKQPPHFSDPQVANYFNNTKGSIQFVRDAFERWSKEAFAEEDRIIKAQMFVRANGDQTRAAHLRAVYETCAKVESALDALDDALATIQARSAILRGTAPALEAVGGS
ncbi:hypothetical protein FJZ36_15210 [Candidatus Poribacteria bacterium]|nr:hypothetical protein [Candidatus Poribacteria bacterium]